MRWRPRALLEGKTIAVFVATTVVATLVFFAVRADGFHATRMNLHDAGVWVTRQQPGAEFGRVNTEIALVDTRLAADSPNFDVVQADGVVLLHDQDAHHVVAVDVSLGKLSGQTDVPDNAVVRLGGPTAAVLDPDSGALWYGPREKFFEKDYTSGEPDVRLGAGSSVAVGSEGWVFAYDAEAGQLLSFTPKRVKSSTAVPAGMKEAQISGVGVTPVVLDPGAKKLFVRGLNPIDLGGLGQQFALQLPGPSRNGVLVAGGTQLVDVSFANGNIQTMTDKGTGDPVPPVWVKGCSYGAWAAKASFAQICDGRDPIVRNFDGPGVGAKLRFRVNRDRVVLNELDQGFVTVFGDGDPKGISPADWLQALNAKKEDDQTQQQQESSQNKPDLSQANRPPIAVDDKAGTRPGRPVKVNVLSNDSDPDGDVLSIETPPPLPPDVGTLAVISNGQALQFTPAPALSDVATFSYTVSDGRGGEATANVTVTVKPEDQNDPPTPTDDKASVEAGKPVSVDVLANDTDPNGDALSLVLVEKPDAAVGSVQFQPGGLVTFSSSPTAAGTVKLAYTVEDQYGAQAPAALEVTVTPPGVQEPPTAVNDYAFTFKGRTASLNLLANDRDLNNDPLTVVRVDERSDADVKWAPDGSFRLTSEQVGSYVLVYEISDGTTTNSALVRVDVLEPPQDGQVVAVRDDATVRAGTPTLVDVLANDIDPSGSVLVIQGVDGVQGLKVEVLEHRLLRITPQADFSSTTSFTYAVSNGVSSAIGTVIVRAAPQSSVNQPPVAETDEITVRAGNVTAVDALRNDHDPEGDPITLVGVQCPADGPPAVGAPLPRSCGDPGTDGLLFIQGEQLRYQAPGAERGSITFRYTISDAAGNLVAGQLVVHVSAADPSDNRAPVPKLVTARAFAGRQVTVRVPLIGVDPDGDAVSLVGVVDPPTLGSVLEVRPDSFVYQADSKAAGTDRFTYRLRDQNGAEATGSVEIGVVPPAPRNSPPVAIDDAAVVKPGQEKRIAVLRNDSDPDDDSLALLDGADGPSAPRLGQIRTDGNAIVYTAPATIEGDEQQASFDYGVGDGRGGVSRGVVTIAIARNRPPAPPIARDDLASPASPGQVVDVDVLANDDDPDGDVADLKVELLGAPQGVSVRPDRHVEVTMGDGAVSFVYRITNAGGAAAEAVVQVPSSKRRPPVAVTDIVETKVNTAVRVDVLANDTDPGGGQLKLVRVISSRNGSTDIDGNTVVFTPTPEFGGDAGFSYQITNGTDDAIGTAVVKVTGQNDPPTMTTGVLQVPAGGERSLDLATLATDPNGDKLTFGSLQGSISGVTASLDGTTLKVSAADDARDRSGQFTVTIDDGRPNGKITGNIDVSVVGSDRPLPTAVDDLATTDQEKPVTIPALANDIDPVGKGLTIVGVNQTQDAQAQGGSLVYTPPLGFFGLATFTYTIGDATNDPTRQRSATVQVTVRGRPDAPSPPTGVIGSRKVNLSWNVPANNGAPIDYYTVRSSEGRTIQCPTNACVFDGLTNGTDYTFTVTAHNVAGDGKESAPSPTYRPDIKPEIPSAPTAKFGDKQITLTWMPPKNEGTPISMYTVQISPAPASGPLTQQVPAAGTGQQSYTWTGLTNGTAYTFRIKATNESGTTDLGPASAPEIPAGVPLNLTAPTTQWGDRYVNVSWTAPNRNGADVTAYEIQVQSGGSVVQTIPVADATNPSWKVTGLSNGTAYQFRFRAQNKAGWSDFSPLSAPTTPAAPPNQVASVQTTPGDRIATVAFTDPANNGAAITSYRYTVNGGAPTTLAANKQIGGLTNGTNYSITVQACNVAGCGSPSPSASVNPYGAPGTPGISASVSGTTITWNWNVPNTNGRPLAYFNIWRDGTLIAQDTRTSFSQGFGYAETHTLTVQAVNNGSPYPNLSGPQAAASGRTVDPPPSVTLTRGTSAVGQPGCSSATCWWLRVQANNMGGRFTVQCGNNSGIFYTYTTNSNPSQGCYYDGHYQGPAYVIVNGVRSNNASW